MTNQSSPLREKDFIAWLRSLPEGYVAGKRSDACGCPLAQYLTDLGYTEVIVSVADKLSWRQGGARVRRAASQWVRNFIIAVDLGTSEYVTAGECLRLLTGESERNPR